MGTCMRWLFKDNKARHTTEIAIKTEFYWLAGSASMLLHLTTAIRISMVVCRIRNSFTDTSFAHTARVCAIAAPHTSNFVPYNTHKNQLSCALSLLRSLRRCVGLPALRTYPRTQRTVRIWLYWNRSNSGPIGRLRFCVPRTVNERFCCAWNTYIKSAILEWNNHWLFAEIFSLLETKRIRFIARLGKPSMGKWPSNATPTIFAFRTRSRHERAATASV